jgi:hypothetical protein
MPEACTELSLLHPVRDDAFPDWLLRQIHEALGEDRLADSASAALHFAVAKVYQGRAAYPQAWEHYRAGNERRRNAFQRAGVVFRPERLGEQVDGLMGRFSADFCHQFASGGLATEQPVFIVGMPRSGKTLVEQILAAHPEVAGGGELADLERQIADAAESLGERGDDSRQISEFLHGQRATLVARRYQELVSRIGGPARRVTSTFFRNAFHLGYIAAMFPRARVIYCRRDAVENCLECYMENFKWLEFTCALEHIGCYYRHHQRLMDHWKQVLPMTIHEIELECLLRDPGAEARRLVRFCGLAWDDRVTEFHTGTRPVRELSQRQARRPIRADAPRRRELYEPFIGPLLDMLETR